MQKALDNPEYEAYIGYIQKKPEFSPFGKLDEDFFYWQPDKSKRLSEILGFFDPEGVYFNPKGLDEYGGYYDSNGVYQDSIPDYHVEEDPAYAELITESYMHKMISLIHSSESSKFKAVLLNLPYATKKDKLECELKEKNVAFTETKMESNKDGKLIKAYVFMNKKEAAEALARLHNTKFLNRKLRVEFPDIDLGLDDVEEDPSKAKQTSAPGPIQPEETKRVGSHYKPSMRMAYVPKRKEEKKQEKKEEKEEKEKKEKKEEKPKSCTTVSEGYTIEYFNIEKDSSKDKKKES